MALRLSFELKMSLDNLYPPKTQNGIDETQLPFQLKCHSYIFYLPKTQNGMVETHLIRTGSVTHTSFTPENSKWNR